MNSIPNPDDFRYRKTKKGEWVVYGPADQIEFNREIPVRTSKGKVRMERIERVGRPFNVDGVEMVYGYPFDDHAFGTGNSRTYSQWKRELWELHQISLIEKA